MRGRLLASLVLVVLASMACAQSMINVTGTVSDPNASAPFSVIVSQSSGNYALPVARTYPWQPGVTYNGGIPVRTNIVATLSPRGSGLDDSAQINAALASCPPGGVVKLNPGVFTINTTTGSPVDMSRVQDCTLRGSGTGTSQMSPPGNAYNVSPQACGRWGGTWPPPTCTNPFNPQGTGTWLYRVDYGTNGNQALVWMGPDSSIANPGGVALTADAPRLSTSLTLASAAGLVVNQLVYLDQITDNNPDVYWDSNQPPNDGARCWNQLGHCQCPGGTYLCGRSISQVVKIKTINGNVVTIYDPLSYGFTVAANAMISTFARWSHGVGIEELGLFGGAGGDGGGNIIMAVCDSCFVRHVDSAWTDGSAINLVATFKSEVRDSYIHESSDPYPGGGGYLSSLNSGAFGNLFENNIMWAGDKSVVMRNTGGGNVFAYNYTDDAFGANFPDSPEAGINAGHYTTPHFELLEGNYSQNYKGDTYWGNSIYITVFRNHLSAKRAAYGGLASYVFNPSGQTCGGYIYTDGYRVAVDMQGSPGRASPHNFVGNVLGLQGQTFLSVHTKCDNFTQNTWVYEDLNASLPSNDVAMWAIGAWQNGVTGVWNWDATAYQNHIRQGNWDWVTASAHWYTNPLGATGASTSGSMGLPDSLYAPSKPAFFGANPWPWVDPSTGAVYTLPAKARFQAGTPNQL